MRPSPFYDGRATPLALPPDHMPPLPPPPSGGHPLLPRGHIPLPGPCCGGRHAVGLHHPTPGQVGSSSIPSFHTWAAAGAAQSHSCVADVLREVMIGSRCSQPSPHKYTLVHTLWSRHPPPPAVPPRARAGPSRPGGTASCSDPGTSGWAPCRRSSGGEEGLVGD